MRRAFVSSGLALLLAALLLPTATPAQPASGSEQASADAAWQKDLAAWRSQREQQLAVPDGWLALVGLEWLKSGVNTLGSGASNTLHLPTGAPDSLAVLEVRGMSPKDTVVQLLAPQGGFPAGFTLDGHAAREGTLTISDAHPSIMAWHGLSLVVLERGDRFVLRIRDADSPTRTGFHGLQWYAPDPAYRVTTRWIPYASPRVERIATAIGTTLELPAPGVAEFLLKGKVYLLEPVLEGDDTTHLFFILRDETSRTTTYGGGRFMLTGLPDHGLNQPGALVLDFNQLYNPPCAYTPYATCPLPPEKNILPVAIEAGEQRFKP
jgi:uncharacterized protein